MKIKVKTSIQLNEGKSLSPRKFYTAEKAGNFYIVEFADKHRVVIDKKEIKECKE